MVFKFNTAFGSNNNSIKGNLIGVGPDGTTVIPNTGYGINIEDGSSGNIIGGTNPADRNIISGNTTSGVRLAESGTTNNVVLGNYIGLDVAGTLDRGNTIDGVIIELGANSNTIGGSTAGAKCHLGKQLVWRCGNGCGK